MSICLSDCLSVCTAFCRHGTGKSWIQNISIQLCVTNRQLEVYWGCRRRQCRPPAHKNWRVSHPHPATDLWAQHATNDQTSSRSHSRNIFREIGRPLRKTCIHVKFCESVNCSVSFVKVWHRWLGIGKSIWPVKKLTDHVLAWNYLSGATKHRAKIAGLYLYTACLLSATLQCRVN